MSTSTLNTLSIFGLVQASYATHALFVLTKLGIFDELSNGPRTAIELAKASGARHEILDDLLAFAVSLRLVRESEGTYRIVKKGLLLTQSVNNWVRPYLLVWGQQLDPAMSHLTEYVLTGEDAFKLAHGDSIWHYYRANPEQAATFVAFMQEVTRQSHVPHIVEDLDVGSAKNLVDVGGGTGSLACALARKYEELDCVVCDQPMNKVGADAYIASQHVKNCSFIGTNIFDTIPMDRDLYTIKHVLHDWDDQNVVNILVSISRAMRYDSRLIIIEGLLDRVFPVSFDNPEFLHARNLEQRVWTPGRVRSTADFAHLGAKAGLRIVGFSHSDHFADISYIECAKVSAP